MSGGLYATHGGGWYNSSLFFRMMVKPKILAALEKAVNEVLCSFLRVGEKGAVVSKQQLSDEFLNGLHACEETPKVQHAAICSETDVDAVLQVLHCLTVYDAEEDGEQCGGQDASLPDAVENGEAARQ